MIESTAQHTNPTVTLSPVSQASQAASLMPSEVPGRMPEGFPGAFTRAGQSVADPSTDPSPYRGRSTGAADLADLADLADARAPYGPPPLTQFVDHAPAHPRSFPLGYPGGHFLGYPATPGGPRESRGAQLALTVSGNTRLNVAFTAVGSQGTTMGPYAQAPLDASTAGLRSVTTPGAYGDDAKASVKARSLLDKIAGGFISGLTGGRLTIKDGVMQGGRRSMLTDGSETFFPMHDDAIQEWTNVARNGDAAWNAFTNQNVAKIIDALRPSIVATVMSEFVARLALLPEADRLPALRCILNDTARGGVEAVRAWRPQLPLSFPAHLHEALETLLGEYKIGPDVPTPPPTPTDDTVNASVSIG